MPPAYASSTTRFSLRSVALALVVSSELFSPLTAVAAAMASVVSTSSPAARRASVAVLGSGVAGSTAARLLAEAGHAVSVFEAGFGTGGRTSTRISRDQHKFQFDHGAQFIGEAKTAEFGEALRGWREAGAVREWTGARIGEQAVGCGGSNSLVKATSEGSKRRYVGYPAMNSISAHLLDHENIDITTRTRACATYEGADNSGKWHLTSHGDKSALGEYDFLIGSDRLSATDNRADLRNAPLDGFKAHVEKVESVPVLVLMLALESPLQGLPYDGITFNEEESGEFGSLGWIARDSSKPGRERDDGRECWVIHSGPKAAKEVLESVKGEKDFDKRRELVRERSKEVLLRDFEKAAAKLSSGGGGGESSESESTATGAFEMPHIVSAVGHRWSAAFPNPPPPPPSSTNGDRGEDCIIDAERNFVGCGDYLGQFPGRVEGAYLSGRAAALAVLEASTTSNTGTTS